MQMIAASPKPTEPSMEEILASIRRIIADDQDGPRSPPPNQAGRDPRAAAPLRGLETQERIQEAASGPADEPDAASPDAVPDAGVYLDAADLDEPVEPPQSPPEETTMDLEPDIAQARDLHTRDVPAHEAPARETEIAATLENHLLSNATDRSVSHAFNMLTHTVLNHNARTLEDLVRDMLRPMLKSWLDENLPVIVERLVRTEIERVARGGR
jgi:uncharacterized protein